jgi:hypothetical protein
MRQRLARKDCFSRMGVKYYGADNTPYLNYLRITEQ